MEFRALAIFTALLVVAAAATQDSSEVALTDDDLYTKLVDLQRRHVDWLLSHPDVTAVDVNHKMVDGERTDQLSLVIWVKEKLPEVEVPHERRLPRHIEGFHTDVIEGELAVSVQDEFQGFMPEGLNATEVPPSDICPCRDPLTALRGGHCIKVKDSDCFGTLGYFTRARRDIGILSNYHVTGAPPNRVTSAPAPNQFPNPPDYVATVTRVAFTNKVDASHSSLCRNPPPPFMLVDGTVVPGTQRAQCWDPVRFCGCTSGCTRIGKIYSTNWCGFVYYDKPEEIRGTYKFCDQILFTPAAQPGDSGSLLINADTNRATGLVFARIGTTYGLANPIGRVLRGLGVRIAV